MSVERSAGTIIFREEGGKTYYLLLHYPSRAERRDRNEGKLQKRQTSSTSRATNSKEPYWDFPKGHIEKGEKLAETAIRETKEETGLTDINFIDGFKETIKYFFKSKSETILKFVTFFLAETKTKDIKISYEHAGFKWLPYKEAFEQATFRNAKEMLKKANDFLSGKSL